MKWLNYCLQRSLSSLFFRKSADIISKHLHIQKRRNKVWEVWECQQKCSILGLSFNWLILNKYKITRILVIIIEHSCHDNILYYVFLKICSYRHTYFYIYITSKSYETIDFSNRPSKHIIYYKNLMTLHCRFSNNNLDICMIAWCIFAPCLSSSYNLGTYALNHDVGD